MTAVVAGASELSAGTFATFAYAGAAIWVCCFLTIGYAFGDQWRGLAADLYRHPLIACLLAVVATGGFAYWSFRRR